MIGWAAEGGLTDRSFHVIGRTCRGIPDQLSFRSSSVEERGKRTGWISSEHGSRNEAPWERRAVAFLELENFIKGG